MMASPVKKIKILQAIRQGKVGGGETHVLDLVNHLDNEKYESVILSFTEGPMVDQLRGKGFKTYVVNTEKPFDVSVWNKVKDIVIAEGINMMHAHGTRAASNIFFSAKLLKIPLLYTVHGWSFHPNQSKLVRKVRAVSERFLVRTANKTICVSESNLREGKKNFPMTRASVIVNGINRDKFNPRGEYPDVRTELGIKPDEILISYIARVTVQKDPLIYVKAIAAVKEKAGLKFLIVGDGDLKDKTTALAKELRLEDHIIFKDFRSDVPALLSTTDIFCLPSLWEGLPIALLEAMAMNKAVIATGIDGITDLITHLKNGLLVPVSDPLRLAEAIQKLAADKTLRDELGREAGSLIEENFGIKLMTDKIQAEYDKLVKHELTGRSF